MIEVLAGALTGACFGFEDRSGEYPGAQTSLGGQTVVSTEDAHFSIKTAPVEEELRYRIPQRRGIQQFDQITVVFFPAEERSILGAKIAIEDFRLMPR